MHALMRVLAHRQLNQTAQLFAISDYDVISDLHTAFLEIKKIFNDVGYVFNKSDQSIVEIVLARIISAIRETNSIETYSAELVDVLDSAFRYSMVVANNDGELIDSPHCKIAMELLSCLFMYYNKKSVMTLTIPVAIKALGCRNAELVKNITSYISLSAIHNSRVLSQYAVQLITNIVNGNYSLLRVVPQIYADNREPFHAHLSQLIRILDEPAESVEEKRALLQFASRVASHKADLLIPYLPRLPQFLLSPATCSQVLHIYLPLCAHGKNQLLSDYLPTLFEALNEPALQGNIATIANVISLIAREKASLAQSAVDRLSQVGLTTDVNTTLPSILTEIEGICQVRPSVVTSIKGRLAQIAARAPHLQRICDRISNLSCAHPVPSNDEVTVISIRNENSSESLLSKRNRAPDAQIISSGTRTCFPVVDTTADASAMELDKNTETLALVYQNRSNSSLSKYKSRSYVSIMAGQSQRSNSENVMNGSRDLSASSIAGPSNRAPVDYASRPPPQYQPPKTQTLPATFAPAPWQMYQMGKDGRVRKVSRTAHPNAAYETTFPAHAGPVTTAKLQSAIEQETISEEPADIWTEQVAVDRGDVVRQFVDHRRSKIRRYVDEISASCPIPIQCTVEGGNRGSKHRMRVHFACQVRSAYCIFQQENLFAFKTKQPTTWLHLMFLQMEASSLATSGEVLCQSSPAFQTLSHCWQCLPASATKNRPFVTLVTSAFPPAKEQEKLIHELEEANFTDCFIFEPISNKWACYSCAHPDKVKTFVEDKVLCGQLKEKRGRWKFLRRWQTKFFTLSTASLTYTSEDQPCSSKLDSGPSIDLRSIRSVKSLGRGNKKRKSLRKAFEIFTADNHSYVLKATDEKKAEEWMQCLQIAVAHARREATL